MKLTEKLKETTHKGTECIRRHAPELAVGSLILLTAGVVYVVHKDKQQRELRIRQLTESGAEVLRNGLGMTVIKGAGPLWETIKSIFGDIEMEPEEVWMIEADENGNKLVTHFGSGDIAEELEI